MDTPASRAISFNVMSTLLLWGIEGKCFNLFAFSIQKMSMEYYKIIHKRLRKKCLGKTRRRREESWNINVFSRDFGTQTFGLNCLALKWSYCYNDFASWVINGQK